MAERGKKSAASLQVVALTGIRRLKLPADLPAGQKAFLQELVNAKPADYFNTADLSLLILLARHSERADLLEAEMQALQPGDLAGLKWLSPLCQAETKTVISILRTLRLTPQARYRPDNARLHSNAVVPRPWETPADDDADADADADEGTA